MLAHVVARAAALDDVVELLVGHDLRRALVDAATAGAIRCDNPDVTARAWWTAIHGLTSALIVHDTFPWGDRQAVIDTLLDTLIAGLAWTLATALAMYSVGTKDTSMLLFAFGVSLAGILLGGRGALRWFL